ncbi:MAG: hypothetical protein IKC65_08140 [Lentisphaeria bacterium]|nr:hypothetical protein [Lentisphaeria bacterium]
MKKLGIFLAAAAAAVVFSGCSSPQLDIGEYRIEASGRRDFIVAYQDMIFLQIKSPEDAPGSLEYWNWAGTYSLDENGEILFDMDRETGKRWRFYFNFLKKRNGIVLNDLSNNKGYLLKYRIPAKRANARPTYMRTGSTGTDPNYTPLPAE